MSGTVTVPWTAECRRCLDEIGGVVTVDLSEVFEVHPVDGETYPIEGDEVDLEPVVRDAALLAPAARAAVPPGLRRARRPTRSPRPSRATTPTTTSEPARDPRWAALDELRLDPS